jgi:hypothetical protein
MKKLIYLCCALMMGSVLFSSCGDDDEPSANNQGENTEQPETPDDNPTPSDPTDPKEEVNDSLVLITYSGSTATVNIPEEMEGVTCTSGTSSHVVLESTTTSKELYYAITGSSTDGSLTITGAYKLSVLLNGVDLTSNKGAAINIQCGKRINLVMEDGTTNSLADYADGSQKACLYTKGHFEIEGNGTLNVTGNANHAIASKEYLQIKKSVKAINIKKAANDAIHVGQFFQMNGGEVTIDENTMNDGIQVEYETDDNDQIVADEENTGSVIIKAGSINITLNSAEDAKGVKAEGDVTISGGTINIEAKSNGSRGIQADGNMTIGEESGTTTITIAATGKKCTVPEDSEDPHKCWGIKIDGELTMNAGTLTVSKDGLTTKNGIKCGTYTKNGGKVTATIKEDE